MQEILLTHKGKGIEVEVAIESVFIINEVKSVYNEWRNVRSKILTKPMGTIFQFLFESFSIETEFLFTNQVCKDIIYFFVSLSAPISQN